MLTENNYITERYVELAEKIQNDLVPEAGSFIYHTITGGIGVVAYDLVGAVNFNDGDIFYLVDMRNDPNFIKIPSPNWVISRLLEMGDYVELEIRRNGNHFIAFIVTEKWAFDSDIWQEALLRTYIEAKKKEVKKE